MTAPLNVKVPPMVDVIVDANVDKHENQDEEEEGRLHRKAP